MTHDDEVLERIMSEENFDRVTGFLMELSDAVELIEAGIVMLRDAPAEAPRLVPALTLLANGFERLLRSALAAAWTRDYERLPDKAEFGRLSYLRHDVLAMWQELARVSASASPDLVATLQAGTEAGGPEYRLLVILTAQAEPAGRYAQQRAYLGGSTEDIVSPSAQLDAEALIRLEQRGRLHAYLDGLEAQLNGFAAQLDGLDAPLDGLEGTKGEFHAARQDAVAEVCRLAAVVAGLFEEGALGPFGREFAPVVSPLRGLGAT